MKVDYNTKNELFVKKCQIKHNNKYDYSKTNYNGIHQNVTIICPIHGEFEQVAKIHVHRGSGCPSCSKIKLNQVRYGTDEFIQKCIEVHGNKYDYSKVEYKNNRTSVKIICPIHSEFEQTPSNHLSNRGCKKCAGYNLSKEQFIEDCIKIHGGKYDYSKINWDTKKRKIEVICPTHGSFLIGKANHRLLNQGCPLCTETKGEREIRLILEHENILFNTQHTFNECKYKRLLPFDFYIEDLNLCIEYDGIQHYKISEFFGGRSAFMKQKHRDKLKNKFCENNGINLLRIKYCDNIKETLLNYLHNKI